ncbi:MAG: undecaprenyl-diphosphate phosphatase [Desulfobacteraceae bacterium]|jgi:undecaprenyl-diphosphatase
MEPIYAVTLGVVQGLTEFLPVSSSGHLVLFQNLFGFTEPELLFDISLHVGTLLAICLVFYRELGSLLTTLLRLPWLLKAAGGLRPLFAQNQDVRLVALIVLGSIPTAFLGLIFHRVADRIFGSVGIVGAMLLITGTLLWLTRRPAGRSRLLPQVHTRDALTIGLVQGMAILPGISRSGSTICAALFLGIDRELAGRYSFLLSIPAIIGALALGLEGYRADASVPVAMMLLGGATAAVTGYAALRLLLWVVQRGRLHRFAPYCWAVGLAALAVAWR